MHNAKYWHFHYGECPDGTAADNEGLCVEDPGPSEEEVTEATNAGDPSTCNGGEDAPPSLAAGNPIHIGTGNKYQREVDIAGWSPFADPLVRHYNSQRIDAPGPIWRHTWQRRVAVDGFAYYDDNGDLRTQDDTLALIRPDGQTLTFYRTGEYALAEHAVETPDDIPAVGTSEYPLHWNGSEWRYRTEGGVREYYDADGNLLRIVGRGGYTQWIERDGEDRIATVEDDFGRTLTFDHDSAGRLVRVLDPAGETYSYAYDGEGRLTSTSDPSGATRRYHYGEFGAPPDYLTGITDANGERSTWRYDDEGRAVLSEHAGGAERVELDYLDGDQVRVTEADGGEHTYDLTTVQGRKLATSIAGGSCSSCSQGAEYEYNEQGLVTRKVDRNGNITKYQYNNSGLQTQRTEAAGTVAERTIDTEWDSERRLRTATIEASRRTEYTYDDHGRVRTETVVDTISGQRAITSHSYHPTYDGVPGQLASVDGPRTDVTDVTRFAYDAEGNRTRVTNALGHVSRIGDHDAYGRPREIVDPNGLTTRLRYDVSGRLVEVDKGGRSTRMDYDPAGNLISVIRPTGASLAYTYDAAGRVTAIENQQGHRIAFALDSQGNRTARHVTDASGEVVREQQQAFDDLGRLVEQIGAQGQATHHQYDDNGNRTRTTTPSGNTTQRAFDALDRLIRQTDALGGNTHFAYDAADRITAVTDPNGNTTRYTYDGFGHRTRVDSPDAGTTTYQYDRAGNVSTKTDARGQITSYAYDALNRRTSALYSDGNRVDYEWDSASNGTGRLARLIEDSGVTAWHYNRHGDILERRQKTGDHELNTVHEYDAAGRRIATVYPSGARIEYQHEAERVTGIAVNGNPLIENAHYAPYGPIAGWTWGDGDVHERHYDRDGRLVAHSMPNGPRALAYSADGQITGISGPNVVNTYGYDAVDQLTEADGVDWGRRYAYDPNGNRLSLEADGETTDYTIASGSNRLLASTGAEGRDYSYDAAGNMTADGDHVYDYNARGRLAAVNGGDTATYHYNALGQRVYKHARMPRPDYAQLSEEASALSEKARDRAREIRSEARAAIAEAVQAKRDAVKARLERDSAHTQARAAEWAAEHHRKWATRSEQASQQFAERADHYQELAEATRGGWWSFQQRIYERLAATYEALADHRARMADDARAQAEAAEDQAQAARDRATAADSALAEAEARANEAQASAKSLRDEARAELKKAATARKQAAKYRRLHKNPPPRRTVERRFV
ncbi:MAG: DUF6531 domain-containing protein, partial [Halofilum sp. (in: g-proteobacteria)]